MSKENNEKNEGLTFRVVLAIFFAAIVFNVCYHMDAISRWTSCWFSFHYNFIIYVHNKIFWWRVTYCKRNNIN